MPGLEIGFGDHLTFLARFRCVVIFLTFFIWLAGLPSRIAIARKHPDAEALNIMGYFGFQPLVPWIQAFIWAFKPTNIVDIRRPPAAELARVRLRLESEIHGVNTSVAVAEAALALARYYLVSVVNCTGSLIGYDPRRDCDRQTQKAAAHSP